MICAVVDTNAEAEAHGGEGFRSLPNQVFYYFAVDDLESWEARAKAIPEAQITAEIQSYPWGERSFYLRDPWGNRLCFVDEPTLFTGEA